MSARILVIGRDDTHPIEVGASEVTRYLGDRDHTVWIDLTSPTNEEQRWLVDVFGLHPLVIEDMLADAPTPKIERFDDYIYMVFHGLADGAEKRGECATSDVDFFLGSNWVISNHPPGYSAVTFASEQIARRPERMKHGAAYIAYLMIEHLTERFLPLMEKLDHEIDTIETSVLRSAGPEVLEKVFDVKHRLQRIRRVGLHQKEILNRLGRGDFDVVPEDMRPFFRDAYDHFVRVVDLNDSFRELVSSAMEAYISMQGYRMNEIMKVLTLISTLMLPLTFIAGVYGMNFDVMPELHWRYGYMAALFAMGSTAAIFFWYFRRKRWI